MPLLAALQAVKRFPLEGHTPGIDWNNTVNYGKQTGFMGAIRADQPQGHGRVDDEAKVGKRLRSEERQGGWANPTQ
jgi:hypothetical protein